MDTPLESIDDAGAETLTNVIPNELLLHIFRFLEYDDLISVEQVCGRWKTVTETWFATKKELHIQAFSETHPLERLRRYGPSIRSLALTWMYRLASDIDWAKEIADRFPNLITLELEKTPVGNGGLKKLSTKCCQLKNVTLYLGAIPIQELEGFLLKLPGITDLEIVHSCVKRTLGGLSINESHASAVFSTCRSLRTLKLGGPFQCDSSDTILFFKFCKECVTLRKLHIDYSDSESYIAASVVGCQPL